jgi:hypothetical protein
MRERVAVDDVLRRAPGRDRRHRGEGALRETGETLVGAAEPVRRDDHAPAIRSDASAS